jgi:hypothetical protein
MATPVNTLTEPGGFQADGVPAAADPGAGSGESIVVAGARAHRPAPHLVPASK